MALLLLLHGAVALAQPSQPERAPERIQQQLEAEGEGLGSSRQRARPAGPTVTFEELLRSPDDVALNIRFVQ